MSLEELKKKFIVDEDALKMRLEPLLERILQYCVIDRSGQVHITRLKLSGREQVMLVLIARAIASQMESGIAADTSITDIATYTGLPENQVRARGNELLRDRLVESPRTGVYKAVAHRIESFLEKLSSPATAAGKR
jgi:hypothetical protein